MNELAGKVAIITGGGHGIGKAIALAYAAAGAAIVIAARSLGPMEEAVAELERTGARAIYLTTNIIEEAECARMVERAISAFGRIDILVNNAGVAGPTGRLTEISLKQWQEVIDINLTGCWLASRAVLPAMAQQHSGHIVNIASLAGLEAYPLRSPYAASKWAMIGLTQTLAAEWGKDGVRVNGIAPGPVAGDRIEQVIKSRAASLGLPEEQVRRSIVGRSAMARMVTEQECARVALFLVSLDSAAVTGQTISVDAGIAMH
ncbi:MAG: SDR family NAD(P)-dependent oxidoreductase [Candidatus Binataceae bacterium]|nr:SDR family NAD(P)-dependent oxidoreductase [Candidatus Binataceae bacterium]